MNSIEEQFNLIAEKYDAGRKKFIPCFDDYYEKTTDFIVSGMKPPARILDLGSGTGLLSMYYYRHFPQSQYLLTDIAEAMLAVARERFRGKDNVAYAYSDYSQVLPEGEFDLIISALSIHHLENDRKPSLFYKLRQKLAPGGAFVNYDQFCGDTLEMSEKLDRYWINQLPHSGLSNEDLSKWHERRMLDRECSLNDESAMLKKSGFANVSCVYSCQKFSVLFAQP